MIPDAPSPLSGPLLDVTALLRLLAPASDWASFCEELRRDLPRVLPAARLDIYALAQEGAPELWFTSELNAPALPVLAAGDLYLQSWFERQGYGAVIMRPLIAADRQCGWLVLAQTQRKLAPILRAAADQLVPLFAMRLRYELANAELAARSAHAATLEQRLLAIDALRLRALLVSGTAHDIGNIFTTIMGHAQLLQQDLGEPFASDLKMISRAAEDGRYLLRRMQSATADFNSPGDQLASLPLVAEEAMQFTRPLWELHENIVVRMVVRHAALVRALGADLREVLINLIMNAIAAMPNGGLITIGCSIEHDQALITVADTGHGIALEHQNEIFQPLQTSREHGSGLGLSVSRAIIEGYGGTLSVKSAPGQGALFTIRLPAEQRDRAVP